MPLTPANSTMLGAVNPGVGGASATSQPAISLPDTAYVWRDTPTDDGLGTQDTLFAVVANYPARLLKGVTAKETVQGGAAKPQTTWEAMFQLGADILPADKVSFNDDSEDALMYEVVSTDAGLTGATVLSATLIAVGW